MACILRGAPECFSWNSFLLSSRIFSFGSQVQSALSEYPFHFTKYLIFPRTTFKSINSSTSYSSSPSIIIGGGGSGFFWEWKLASTKGVSNDSLKTGCIFFHVVGSVSLYTDLPSFFMTSKGPCRLSSNFPIGLSILMLVPSNQTLSPALYSLACDLFLS